MRVCTQCHEAKAIEKFAIDNKAKDGLHTWCRACKAASARCWAEQNTERRRAYQARRYAENPEAYKKQARLWHRNNHARSLENKRKWKLSLHGLNEDQKAAMLHGQGDCCAICKEPLDMEKARVDHCHTTQAIRGLLCHWCNVGLGHFSDSPTTLRAAADYLERTAARKSA
jgi:DNA repair exonuclease SbcCD ATPase subunit